MTAPDRWDRRDPCEVCGEPTCVCEETWPEDDGSEDDITTRVVMFSSGVGSWAAARRVADRHGTGGLVLLFTDVGGHNGSPHAGEDADNYRFLAEAAADIGGELTVLREGRDVWQVFRDQRFIGNTRVSNCSRTLKQEPARRWLDANCDPATTVVYVGIDWSEQHRLPAMHRSYAPFRLAAPLVEPPYLDKRMILDQLRARGVRPPRLYALGAEHSNCGGFCVRAGQGQFAWLLQTMPDRYAYHEQREQELRDYLGADVAILRDRRGGETRPLTLRALRERVEAGGQVDLFDVGGCGCFTSEPADDRDHVLDLTRPCWCGATAVGDLDVRDHDPADYGLRAVRDLRTKGDVL